MAETDASEGQTVWQPGGAEEDSRLREGNGHLHLAYDEKGSPFLRGHFSGSSHTISSHIGTPVSVPDGIVALGKAHTRSDPPLCSLTNVALETVPMFVWLNTDRSRPRRVQCRPLPFSTPLSLRRSVLCSGLSMFRKFLKPRSTSALPNCRPDVIYAVLASLSARSFPLTRRAQGSRSTNVFAAKAVHGCVPVGAAHS